MPQQPETRVQTSSAEGTELLPAEVLATLSHEFRDPLATILGYTTTLLRHDLRLTSEERQDFLRAIHKAGTHLEKLVERFLDLADLKIETRPISPNLVDLLALAHEAITAVRPRQTHPLLLVPALAGQQSTQDAEQTKELVITGDRRLLRTMFDVLLENAIAYSPPGCPIEIHLGPTEALQLDALAGSESGSSTHVALTLPPPFQEHDLLLEIQVHDQGMGIAPEHLERIFQRFYRGDTRLTREVNGLSLGLTLCLAIVARHQGMLWVESIVGEGSIFHVVLPQGRAGTRGTGTRKVRS